MICDTNVPQHVIHHLMVEPLVLFNGAVVDHQGGVVVRRGAGGPGAGGHIREDGWQVSRRDGGLRPRDQMQDLEDVGRRGGGRRSGSAVQHLWRFGSRGGGALPLLGRVGGSVLALAF